MLALYTSESWVLVLGGFTGSTACRSKYRPRTILRHTPLRGDLGLYSLKAGMGRTVLALGLDEVTGFERHSYIPPFRLLWPFLTRSLGLKLGPPFGLGSGCAALGSAVCIALTCGSAPSIVPPPCGGGNALMPCWMSLTSPGRFLGVGGLLADRFRFPRASCCAIGVS